MTNVLDKIKAYKLEDVAARKAARPLSKVEAAARDATPTRGFATRLQQAADTGYGLIAEVTRQCSSRFIPSPGTIKKRIEVSDCARVEYESATVSE